ncbi:MAG: arsenate reductase ArsC [Methermicoccaceae archaeon]
MADNEKQSVLFICAHNSARSQMAEGLLRSMYGSRYDAYSAGSDPMPVHPLAIEVMAEIGIDISSHTSKSLDDLGGRMFDYVVAICGSSNEQCPFYLGGKTQLHAGVDDPLAVEGSQEEMRSAFRRARDELKDWIEKTFGRSE